MFEPADEPAVVPEDVRVTARARLASIAWEFPVQRREEGVRRARRISPGVYRAPGLPPRSTVADQVGSGRSASADPGSADQPPGLAEWPAPGPRTAAVLDRMDASVLSSGGLLDAVAGWEQLIGWAQARQAELIAEFARRRPGPYAPDEPGPGVSEFAADEIAARLRVSRRAAEIKLGLAVELADRLPGTAAALRAGRIDVTKAKAIAELTANLSDAQARAAVEARVLARAAEQTAPELRRSLLRAVARVEPAAHVKRHRKAREERFLRVRPCCDGMAELTGLMSAEDALVVFGAVDSLARCAAPDDPRSIDARRVDALVDLCRPGRTSHDEDLAAPHDAATAGSGSAASASAGDDVDRWAGNRAARRAARCGRGGCARCGAGRGGPEIRVTVAASTLFGLDDRPGELAGYGPIDAETARRIAADPDATWRRLVTDPTSGTLLDYGTRVYRPPESLSRHVLARDQVCCFPGCRQPAERCDLDHGVPFPEGPTCAANLIPLCRHHHRAKTFAGWRWRRDPDDGTIIWTAPTGHQYQVPTPATLDGPDDLCAELAATLAQANAAPPDRPPPDRPPPDDDPPPF